MLQRGGEREHAEWLATPAGTVGEDTAGEGEGAAY